MADTPNDYHMSPRILEMIKNRETPFDTSQAVIADIVTQRMQSHHRASMEAIDCDTRLEMLLGIAPQIISMTLADGRAIPIDIAVIHAMTDDLVKLGIRKFAEQYNNLALVDLYDETERRAKSGEASL